MSKECAAVVIGSVQEEAVSKVCSAHVVIGSGNVLLLCLTCAPSGGRSSSEDAEEGTCNLRLYAPP